MDTISKCIAGDSDEIVSDDEFHHLFRAHKYCSDKNSYTSKKDNIANSIFHKKREKINIDYSY
jgi:hypothetical protein